MSTDEAKSRMKRILSLLAEIDDLKADIREVYGEEKAAGGDKTAMGAAISIIRKREKNSAAFEERNAIVDLYLAAFDQPSHMRAHVHTREATTKHQPAGSSAERDPQSAQHGSDSRGGAGGDSPHHSAGSEQESAVEPQARNEPGNVGAASGGERFRPLPETRPIAKPRPAEIDLTIPASLDRRVNKPEAA